MQELAEALKALSEEVRLRLLLLLSEGELCVCDLMRTLELPQSTVSRHLTYLKKSGWVEYRRQGVWMHYRLREAMAPFQKEILTALLQEGKSKEQARRDAAKISTRRRGREGFCGANKKAPP